MKDPGSPGLPKGSTHFLCREHQRHVHEGLPTYTGRTLEVHPLPASFKEYIKDSQDTWEGRQKSIPFLRPSLKDTGSHCDFQCPSMKDTQHTQEGHWKSAFQRPSIEGRRKYNRSQLEGRPSIEVPPSIPPGRVSIMWIIKPNIVGYSASNDV